jgi:hypothetical protein
LLTSESARASVSSTLISSTVQAAVALAAGQAMVAGTVSATALSLANGASRTMLLTKWITTGAAALVLTGGAVSTAISTQLGGGSSSGSAASAGQGSASTEGGSGSGAGEAASPTGPDEAYARGGGRIANNTALNQTSPAGAGAAASAGGGSPAAVDLETLLKARYQSALKRLEAQRNHFDQRQLTIDRYLASSRSVMIAEFQANGNNHDSQRAAIQNHVDRLSEILGLEIARMESGPGGGSEANVVEAEQELADARVLLARFDLGEVAPELQASLTDSGGGGFGGYGGDQTSMMNSMMSAGEGGAASSGGGGRGAGMANMMGGGGGRGGMSAGSASAYGSGMGIPGGTGGAAEDMYAAMGSGGASGGMGMAMPAGGGGAGHIDDPDGFQRDGSDEASTQLRSFLNTSRVSMPYENPTPLEDVLDYVAQITANEDRKNGIPIYVDPKGLEELEQTMQSPIQLNLEGVPLRTTLWLVLRQLGLSYAVIDGVVVISTPDELALMIDEGPMFDREVYQRHRSGQPASMMMGGMGGGGFQ